MPCHLDKAECRIRDQAECRDLDKAECLWWSRMSAPVHRSALGQAFWHHVRLGNLTCELYERENADGTLSGSLLPGPYYPRPNTPSPLDSNITRAGRVRLRFRVKVAGPDAMREAKIDWSYIGHGQNRDSMLGKLQQPRVCSILSLLKYLYIPEAERQSAKVLEKERVAHSALALIEGIAADWEHPTDQVHIILKLHRVRADWESQCGNEYYWEFLPHDDSQLAVISCPAGFQLQYFDIPPSQHRSACDKTFLAGHRSQRGWDYCDTHPQRPLWQSNEVPSERNHADPLQIVQICLEAATGHPDC